MSSRHAEIAALLKPPSRTIPTVNSILSALNRSKSPSLVPPLFSSLFPALSLTPDHVSYGILIKSHCLLRRASSHALPLLHELRSKNLHITPVILTTILDSLYKESKPDQAEKIWQEMKSNAALDLPAYNVRIMHYAFTGRPKDILNLIEEMEAAGFKPDIITFNYLMTCYCNNGRLEDAKKVYRELGARGCEPNAVTFNNFVHLLCKNGDFAAAAEVSMDGMKRNKVPDFGTTKMLVEGLLRGSKVRAAKRVVSKVRNKFPAKFEGGWKELGREVGLKVEDGAAKLAVAA
ncbi:TPR-like protein [Dioscorea alata]|uniref:TPR-like protein n=1 Tax=Dioscorea alata TaxID=55571 RepID=A0ACB7V729_DIOAL|nr:TPR-like protein [Dioscorea alata]